MVRNKFVHHNGNALHYAVAGNGNSHLLLFHGFGQDLSVFEFLARSLTGQYTFYVFDLYFHGRSTWTKGEQTLEKKEWRETIEIFLKENNISRFQVGGFSLGGKFALATLDGFHDRIDKIFLIAPDGVKTSFWYSMATYPVALRLLFKSMILKPERFLSIANFLRRSRLTDNGLVRFAEYRMNSKEKREQVYYSWVCFRHMKCNINDLVSKINDMAIAVVIVVGQFDQVIKPSNIYPFAKRLKDVRFEIVESGHSGLINESISFFKEE